MNVQSRQLLYIVVFAMGLVLMVGGIASGKSGAWIIGLIVAAVNYQQWRSRTVHAEE
jgi:hypothetical protein